MQKILLKILILSSFALYFWGCSSSGKLVSSENQIPGITVNTYLNQFPAETNVKQFLLGKSLAGWNADSLKTLIQSLESSDSQKAVRAEYAVQSIYQYAKHPETGANSKKYLQRLLIDSFNTLHTFYSRHFLLVQLDGLADNSILPFLEPLVYDKKLAIPAIQILENMGGSAAGNILHKALRKNSSPNSSEILKSLGKTGYKPAIVDIRKIAADNNNPLSEKALGVLIGMGDADAEILIEKSSRTANERALYLLRLADNLKTGKSSGLIYAKLYNSEELPVSLRIAALNGLVRVNDKSLKQHLLKGLRSSNPELRAAVYDQHNGLDVDVFLDALDQSSMRRQCEAIKVLGQKTGKKVLSKLIPLIHHDSSTVALTAAQAILKISVNEASMILPLLLSRDFETAYKDEIIQILRQLPKNDLVKLTKVKDPQYSAISSLALILAADSRNITELKEYYYSKIDHPNRDVRYAALAAVSSMSNNADFDRLFALVQQSGDRKDRQRIWKLIAEVVADSESPEKFLLGLDNLYQSGNDTLKQEMLRTYKLIGGMHALSYVLREWHSADDEIKNHAFRTLSQWPDEQALQPLMQIISKSEQQTEQILCTRAMIRILNSMDSSDSVAIKYFNALSLAPMRIEEKKLLIGALAKRPERWSFALLRPFLNDTSLSKEVYLAVVNMVENDFPLSDIAQIFLNGNETESAEQEDSSTGGAEDEVDEEFKLLFNGKNLDGWQVIGNNPGRWRVENGVLKTDGEGGGWIATAEEYSNFILHLEFRVPDGGNSGIFLRAPDFGDPAYTGMEVQVLDDYAEKYSTLKPWQYTASLYGLQAPSSRKTKAAGEWQNMEISADNSYIKIVLNGDCVNSVNLIDYMDRTKGHPGIKRRKGLIGLQNHNTTIEYKNIKIQRIN